jgi:peptidoglycan/xylan/chitin deacetylase (PgdA/CDA1 family)
LFYHQLVERRDPRHQTLRGASTFAEFRAGMEFLRDRMHPLTPEEFLQLLAGGGPWPPRAVLVTFDDGYRTNLRAGAILAELGMSGIFFVNSDALDAGFMPWYLRFANIVSSNTRDVCESPIGTFRLSGSHERRKSLARMKEHLLSVSAEERERRLDELSAALGSQVDPSDESFAFMTPDELRRLSAMGMMIGSHGASHDNLCNCDDARLRAEIVECSRRLSDAIDGPIRTMSYPDGRYDRRVIEAVRSCHEAAFAATALTSFGSPYELPRRAADGAADLSEVCSWKYVPKLRFNRLAKRLLGIPVG